MALAAVVLALYTLVLPGMLGVPGQGAALARRQHDKLQVWVALGAADVASCSAGFLRWDWEQAVDGAWGAECAHCVEEQTSLAFQGELKF